MAINFCTCGGEHGIYEHDGEILDLAGELGVEQLGQLLGVALVPLDQNLADRHAGLKLSHGLLQNITWNA